MFRATQVFYRQSTLNRYLIFAPGVTNSIQFWISYRVVTYSNWRQRRRRRRRNQMTIKRMVMTMLIDKMTASTTTTVLGGASTAVIPGSWVVLAVESSQQRQTNNEWKIKFSYLHLDEMNTFIHQTAKKQTEQTIYTEVEYTKVDITQLTL